MDVAGLGPAKAAVAQLVSTRFPWLAEHNPRPPHLVPYAPMYGGAFVTCEYSRGDEDHTAYCARVGACVARLYEGEFAAGDEVYLYVIKEGAHGWLLPEGEDVVLTDEHHVDLSRFSQRFVGDDVDDEDDVRLTAEAIGADSMVDAEWTAGVDFWPKSEDDDPDIPFVEMLTRIERPGEIDHRTLFTAMAHKDFYVEGRPHLGWTYMMFVNASTAVILDMPDDRNAGLHAPQADQLRASYVANAEVLNDYRREHMTNLFGFWPKPEGFNAR